MSVSNAENGVTSSTSGKEIPSPETDLGPPSSADDGDINCIFLCEFHPVAGPKITIQVPKDQMTIDLFRIVNQYIIPKVPLQRSFLSVSMLGKKILGYPIRIESKAYARNAFYFNLCFVFQPTTRTIGYEPVVKKLTEYLISLEMSERILSQINQPQQCERIERLLTYVRNDINRDKVCLLQEGCTTIPLSVVSHYRETVIVGAHQAPVLIENFFQYKQDQWDLTTLRILPFIDGFNHVQRISALAHVDMELVKECVKHLVILDVALLVPIFQYNNMYRPTPKLSSLAKCLKMQKRCVERCSLKPRKCSVRDVFRMFASMAHGATFGEVCVRFNPPSLNINDRQMVLFGLVEGLIRVVNKFPITVQRNLFVNTNCFTNNDDDDDEDNCVQNGTSHRSATIFNSFENDDFFPNSLINGESRKTGSSKPLPRSGHELTKQNNLVQILKKFYIYYNMQNRCNANNCRNGFNGSKNEGMPQVLYNGVKCFDEICCAIGFSHQQLDNLLSRDKHCIVLFK